MAQELATPRLWILPLNDLEMSAISELLKASGEMQAVSRQPHGATWQGLEAQVAERILSFQRDHPQGEVFGVELAGPNPYSARNIDHHTYHNEDRRHPLSSLEQVALILGAPLNRFQHLVAANDRAYIPGMLSLGASTQEIAEIRCLDRTLQGVTARQEQQAAVDIAAAEWRDRSVLVTCPEGSSAAHDDMLFGRATEWLLAASDRWSYSGPRHRLFHEAGWTETHWSGGAPESGYFGIERPSPASQERLRRMFWDEATPRLPMDEHQASE